MTKQKSLKLNFIMNAILTMSSFIFPLITFPYVSRILLPEGMGKVSFATSVISYFAMFAQLGIPTYGIRACARVRDDRDKLSKCVHEIFIINSIMTIFTYIVFLLALMVIPRLQQDRKLFLIVSSTLLFNVIGMEWLYKALEQYSYITVRSIVFKFIALVTMLFLIHQKSDYVTYGAISIFASSASSVLNFTKIHNYIDVKKNYDYDFKQHLKPIAVFFAMSCAVTIYTNLDTVMLGFMKTDTDVGYYNAAIKIKTILATLVSSLGAVLLPRASYYIENNMMKEFENIMQKAFNFIFLVAIPLMIYFISFAKEGIYFLSGSAYSESIIPMQIITPTLLFIGLSNIMGIQILVPLGKEKAVLYSEMAGAIVDLIINLMLIPSMSSTGTAIGTLVAEVIVTVWQYLALRNTVAQAYRQVKYIPMFIGGCLGTAASLWTKTLGLSEFFTLVISATLFFGVYLLVLTIAKEPLTLEIEKQCKRQIKRCIEQ